ncbi:4Fe-4S binding protein [Peptococcaceae bacterium 1198_IL3148]
MKKLAKDESMCIACHNCEQVCSTTYFKVENSALAAIRVWDSGNADVKLITCTQCGECIDICPAEAIYRDNKGVVRIKKARCVGCFACVGFCPEAAMFQQGDNIEPFKCVACGICAKQCPTGAIFIEE